MILSHLETCSNKCAPLNVGPDPNTMVPLLGIEPHSSLLVKQLTDLSFRRDGKMLLADLICHSQTPPMFLAKSGFLFHVIQSVF